MLKKLNISLLIIYMLKQKDVVYNVKIKISDFPSFYINLDKDIEKRNSTEDLLNKLKFQNFSRIKGVEISIPREANEIKTVGQIYGCLMSHKEALSKMDYNFIVFEDDIGEINFIDEIEIPDDADALYMGHMSWGLVDGIGQLNSVNYEEVDGFPNIYRVYNALGAHAILYISKDYTQDCLDSLKKNAASANLLDENLDISEISADVLYARHHPKYKVYALGTPAFCQLGYYEDVTSNHIASYK